MIVLPRITAVALHLLRLTSTEHQMWTGIMVNLPYHPLPSCTRIRTEQGLSFGPLMHPDGLDHIPFSLSSSMPFLAEASGGA